MRVSVIINNYNYARFVGAAIESALAQTHDDVEVVVVDDGSTDASAEVIAGFGDRIVPVLKPNGGQGSAFNAGFAVATGEVVIFLDADDRLGPTAAGEVAAIFEGDPSAAAVQYPLRHIDESGTPIGVIQPSRVSVLPDGDLRDQVLQFRCYHWQATSGNAYRRDALARILPMPEAGYRISADAYVNELIPFCGPIRRAANPLAEYRIHGASNYRAKGIDAAFFRRKLDQIEQGHRNLVRLGPVLGVDPPDDPGAALDAAYLGFRLSSLVLDPGAHPHAEDRRVGLAVRGIEASLTNPSFPWWHRPKRALWFAAMALAPHELAATLARTRTPDAPR